MTLNNTLTRAIALTRRRLVKGGLLQPVEWGTVVPVVPPDRPDPRGRNTFTWTPLDALIEERPALDHKRFATERADDTVLTILQPVAITDSDLFRWGDPVETYSIKKVDGVIKNETTGTRYASEVTVIR